MSDAYWVHTNRQNHSDIDLHRLFDEIGVAAAYSDREDWGSQLDDLKPGDRVIAYNKPTQEYLAVGTVEDTWDDTPITDPEQKVAPNDDAEEFHVNIDWEGWHRPGEGYPKEEVYRVFDYSDRFAPPQTVFSINQPDEKVDTVYSVIAEGRSFDEVVDDSDDNESDTTESGNSDLSNPTGRRLATSQRYTGRRIFVQRGSDPPYRQNIGTSLTTPLSPDLRAELKQVLEEADVEDPKFDRLTDLLDDEELTAWGSRNQPEQVRSMDDGDLVLYIDRGANRGTPDIRYVQEIDLALPEPMDDAARTEVQGRLAELIWRDASFTSLWFSTSEVTYYENPTDREGYEAFNEVIREVDPDFSYYDDWFTSGSSGGNLVSITPEYLEYYGGADEFLGAIEETQYVRATERPTPQYLLIDCETLYERDFQPVVHEFDGYDADPGDAEPDDRVKYAGLSRETAPAQADLLIETDVHGYALLRDGDRLVGRAKVGCAFGKTVDDDLRVDRSGSTFKLAPLVDYREFPSPVSINHDLLTFDDGGELDPYTDMIAPIAADPLRGRRTFETAVAAAISPEYYRSIPRFVERESLQQFAYQIAAVHLVSGKNVIFYGPPGTGKTRAATRLSTRAFGLQHDFATAHAELTNYDIVGGYAPGADKGTEEIDETQTTSVSWRENPGIVTEAVETCQDQLRSDARHHWLVFDELNRANLDQAFGDIFTLLDLDYRTEQPLTYAETDVMVPLSFRLLGTMNTEDQAKLFSLGGAFRRRFGFVPVQSLLAAEEATDEAKDDGNGDGRNDTTDTDVRLELPANAEKIRTEIVYEAVLDDLTRADLLVEDIAPVVHLRDATAIDPIFGTDARLQVAYETVTDPSTYEYDDVDGLDVVMGLAGFLEEEQVLTLGHTHLIDIAKFLTVAELVDPEGVDRQWLDEAVVAYVLPQLDSFFGRLREEEAIGQQLGDGSDSLSATLDEFLELLGRYGLDRSRHLIESRDHGIGIV